MTAAELKIIVLSDIDDSVDGSILMGWLNRGSEYVQQGVILPDLETTAALTFTNGLASLPGDFMHFVELQIGTSVYREEIDFEQRHSYAGPGAFYFWGSQIGVVPAVTASGTLAYVQQAPALVLDADVPKIPTIFQPLIAEYAKGLYRAANGSYAKAVAHYTEVDNAIDRLTGKLRRRTRRKSTAWGDIRDQYPNYP
jgi:hypothetical protein